MKNKVIMLASVAMLATAVNLQAQTNWGTNTGIVSSSSALGDGNFVPGVWSTAIGTNNGVRSTNSLAVGLANNINTSAINSGAFGANVSIQAPYSFGTGYSTAVTGVNSVAMGRYTRAAGSNSFVFGLGSSGTPLTNSTNNSFLVGFKENEPGFSVSRSNTMGPMVGVGTDSPTSRVDIRLGDKQEIVIQSETANTYSGFSFRHNTGEENWRIRNFSNFAGGYDNMLGINSGPNNPDGDLWLSADQVLIGSYFDFDDCLDCDEYELFVRRGIRTEKVKVDVAAGVWADYVFEDKYDLMPLDEVENFITANHHLPDVPSAECMETEGLDVAASDALLLQKIEELTLYMIELKKQNDTLNAELTDLKENQELMQNQLNK